MRYDTWKLASPFDPPRLTDRERYLDEAYNQSGHPDDPDTPELDDAEDKDLDEGE